MSVRVGINGFGRIGRSFTRAILARGEQANVELVAVNDPFGDAHTMAFLLKHDSVGGTLPNEIKVDGNGFSIDGAEIKKLEEREPSEIPWGDNGVDVVIESTGPLHGAREGRRAPQGRRQARRDLRAVGRRRRDDLHGRERRRVRREGAHRDLQRVVHDQLPGADDACAARALRHRAGFHQHGARLHRAISSSRTKRSQPDRVSPTCGACARRPCRSSPTPPARRARSVS